MSKPLGRITPSNFDHVETAPLSALGDDAPTKVPLTPGVNWYTSFDTPRQLKDGTHHLPDVSKGEKLGTVRGGHCFCLLPLDHLTISDALWAFYNQGDEGACEGFGHAKAQTILRGETFDAFWLYDQARKREGTYPSGEGTTNKAVVEVLEQIGLRTQTGKVTARRGDKDGAVEKSLGISTVRWATTVDEVLAALGRPGADAIPFSNSWGIEYPKEVWLPTATLERLLAEDGECDVVTDR